MNAPVRIAVVGLGGLGTPTAIQLVRNWRSERPLHLLLIDGDRVERTNLNRQLLFTPDDVEQPKAPLFAQRLGALFPAPSVSLVPHSRHLDANNIDELLGDMDLVLDGTDSVRAKVLMNDFCVSQAKPYIYAGVVGEGGQTLRVLSGHGGPCLRCLYGDFSEEDIERQEMSCASAGILGPVAGVIGTLAADLALEMFQRPREEIVAGRFMWFSHAGAKIEERNLAPSSECSLGCGRVHCNLVDLRSKKCPETFLYSKVAISTVREPTIFELAFSSEAIAQNVRNSLAAQRLANPVSPFAASDQSWRIMVRAKGHARE